VVFKDERLARLDIKGNKEEKISIEEKKDKKE
jgi:hypothetical protein